MDPSAKVAKAQRAHDKHMARQARRDKAQAAIDGKFWKDWAKIAATSDDPEIQARLAALKANGGKP